MSTPEEARAVPAVQDLNKKRTGYLEWSDYFMAIAFLSAQRSKDPLTQVGACIVNKENRIVGIGYNGMPNGCDDDELPWGEWDGKPENWLGSKNPYVCHAVLNAVLNKMSADLKDSTIYVSLFPCNECAKVIIQAGIREVVYAQDKYSGKEFEASKRLMKEARVKHRPTMFRQFVKKSDNLTIDFDEGICKIGIQESGSS